MTQDEQIDRACFEVNPNVRPDTLAYAKAVARVVLRATDPAKLEQTLFNAIAHGDDEHRAWLKEAIDAHFAGQPVPAPRGGGLK